MTTRQRTNHHIKKAIKNIENAIAENDGDNKILQEKLELIDELIRQAFETPE